MEFGLIGLSRPLHENSCCITIKYMKCKNTLQKGSVRYIVFREGETWYGVGLEFNIVESGDTPREALILLFEALQGYVESAKKIKARPHTLNQKPDLEYEKMWQLSRENARKSSGNNIYTTGSFNIANKDLALV